MFITPPDFVEFKRYAAYLLNHQQMLEELTQQYAKDLQQAEIPLLQYLEHLSPQEFQQMTTESLLKFLHHAVEGKAMLEAKNSIEEWKNNQLPDIPKEKVQIRDIIRIYSIRKMLFLEFLPQYTQDISLYTAILKELEKFHAYLEEYAFQTYMEIQQEELYKEKEFVASLIDNAVEGIISFDTELRITEWNPVFESWYDLKKQDAIGKKVFDLFPLFEHTEGGKAFRAVFQGKRQFVEGTFTHRTGYYEANVVPLLDNRGEITGGLCIVHDTSRRRETEHKLQKAYRKIVKKEYRLREAQAIAKLGSWEWRVKKDKLSWSSEMKRILGYEQEMMQFSMASYLQHVHPDDRELVSSRLEHALKTFQSFSFEHRVYRKDQAERWLLVHGKVAEKPLCVSGTALDITERKAREKELHELHYFLQQITQAVPCIIFIYDLQCKENVFTNQEISVMLGYSPQEALQMGADLQNMPVHPEDMKIIVERDLAYTSLKPEETMDIQFRMRHKNGNWHWLRSKSKIFKYDDQGRPLQILGIAEDVSELKEAEQKILQARDFYQQVLEDFPALIWQSGTNGMCNYFNKTWLEFTGRSREQEMGEGWTEGVHPLDLAACMDTYLHAFQQREPFVMDYRLRRNDGTYRSILDYGKPLYDLSGEFMGYLGVCFDIQDRKDAENEIHESNQELSAALEELTAAEEQLRQTNEELEKRVETRTRELASSELQMRKTLVKMIELNEELAAQKMFLDSVISQSPLSTWIADAQGTMIRVNQACMDLFQIPDPSVGIGKYNILKDEVLMQSPHYPDVVSVFEEGKVARFETEYDLREVKHIHVHDGRKLSLIGTVFPIKNREGKVTHAVVQHEDITEKRRAEISVRESEEQLRLITDALPVLIGYIDTSERYRFVNQLYEKWFEQPKHYIIGKHIREVIGEKAYANVSVYLASALSGQNESYELQQDYGDRGTRYISAMLIPHKENNIVKGVYALAYDISERKQTEQKLEKLYTEVRRRNKELKRINTDLDNFIYTASHDLRSPVSNLEGLLNIMLKEVQAKGVDKELKLLQMMETSVEKLKRTINDLIEITKVQKEIEQQAQEKISFWELTEEVQTELQNLIQEGNAVITTSFKVQQIQYAISSLRSIIYNLLSNAIKYRSTERPLQIAVSTYLVKERVVLSVKDNGLGMTEAQQKKLFTMFRRMHTHVEGTGIGLYTIKRIIENNGGSIKVASVENQGTEFRVIF